MERKLILVVSMVLVLAGCTTIPRHGSVLNQKVSEGIARNQVETEKIIKALADVERAILDQEWDSIYIKVEKVYMTKNNIMDATQMTQSQRRAIAANAAKTYYDLLNQIAVIENKLISQSRANSQILIEINDEITKYLLSTETLEAARQSIANKLSELVGFDLTSITGVGKKLIGGV